eukprot:CAMPEP_0204386694 /NCGR_PEP_ID=MMETSP0469-20131031/58521_1 /ASSEMBLY_ACC=CAM_ASM_000384 /TAXON_ID=2969 /ORGANISM="Oxyrrhis marina" /LENGTH=70 /DNA_ID=CAMNT_0051379957 /DNA_START=45 /DNA_END=257 /DNA_ORIENTATION=+
MHHAEPSVGASQRITRTQHTLAPAGKTPGARPQLARPWGTAPRVGFDYLAHARNCTRGASGVPVAGKLRA